MFRFKTIIGIGMYFQKIWITHPNLSSCHPSVTWRQCISYNNITYAPPTHFQRKNTALTAFALLHPFLLHNLNSKAGYQIFNQSKSWRSWTSCIVKINKLLCSRTLNGGPETSGTCNTKRRTTRNPDLSMRTAENFWGLGIELGFLAMQSGERTVTIPKLPLNVGN